MSIQESIQNMKQAMQRQNIDPAKGLGDDLFLFASTLMPVVNVDLLVFNRQGQVLLSWRDDDHCGTGWHIPGGCVRFRETLADRIRKTAVSEFGQEVLFDHEVLHVFEIFNEDTRSIRDQQERAHFITLVIACYAEKTLTAGQIKHPDEPGYLKWFASLPEDLLGVQHCYREQWTEINKKLKGRFRNGNLEE